MNMRMRHISSIVCFSVLQCVAVCCSVLQCGVVYCSLLQSVTETCFREIFRCVGNMHIRISYIYLYTHTQTHTRCCLLHTYTHDSAVAVYNLGLWRDLIICHDSIICVKWFVHIYRLFCSRSSTHTHSHTTYTCTHSTYTQHTTHTHTQTNTHVRTHIHTHTHTHIHTNAHTHAHTYICWSCTSTFSSTNEIWICVCFSL